MSSISYQSTHPPESTDTVCRICQSKSKQRAIEEELNGEHHEYP